MIYNEHRRLQIIISKQTNEHKKQINEQTIILNKEEEEGHKYVC